MVNNKYMFPWYGGGGKNCKSNLRVITPEWLFIVFFPQLLQQTDVYFSKSVGRSISYPFLVLQEYIRRFRSIGYCDIQFVRKPAKKDMSEQNIQEFYTCFLWFKISPVLTGLNFFQVNKKSFPLVKQMGPHFPCSQFFLHLCSDTHWLYIWWFVNWGQRALLYNSWRDFFWHRMGMDGRSS